MSESNERTTKPSLVTVERVAYALVALLAVWLRWAQLGIQPLSEGEAVQALAAYRFLHGSLAGAPAGTVPALFTANLLGFTLLGAGDNVARWLPAVAGLVLVLLPYGLRHRLGRGGALAASLLLAISPTAVYQSRLLDGSIVVAACGLALLVGLVRFVDTHRPGGLYLAAGALGLGLCAGPGIYSLLLVFLVFGLVLLLAERLRRREGSWSALRAAWRELREEKGWAARAGAVLAAALGLTATALMLRPANAGYAADLIGQWVQGFSPVAGGPPFSYPWLLLLRYEPLIVALGLLGAAIALRRRSPDARSRPGGPPAASTPPELPVGGFLAFWALGAALLVGIAGHRPAGNVLLIVVPLALLAGQGIERAWHWARRRARWPAAAAVAAVALGLAVFLYLQLTAYSLAGVSSMSLAGMPLQTSTGYLLLGLLALTLLIALGGAVSALRGADVLVVGGWLALLVGLGLWSFKSAWGVSHLHAADPRELMIGQTTAPEVRTLVRQLEQLSLDKSGDAHTLQLTVDSGTGPALEWALRDFEQQTMLQILSSPPATAVVVTVATPDLPIGEGYRGQEFPLRISWQPWTLNGQGFVRWLLFSAGSQPVPDQQVVLWVKVGP